MAVREGQLLSHLPDGRQMLVLMRGAGLQNKHPLRPDRAGMLRQDFEGLQRSFCLLLQH